MSQPRTLSAIEAAVNVGLGYLVAVVAQILIFPLFGIHVSAAEHFGIAALFTLVSLGRSYAIRRLFNRWAG